MAYINVDENVPGIRSLVLFSPETGAPLYALAQTLLRGGKGLAPAERELIAAHVSSRNECRFCCSSHAAAARALYGPGDAHLVDEVLQDTETAPVSEPLKRLLDIAGKTQFSGKAVQEADIIAARAAGASDTDIHDTVLIAAAFSMFNRYVDGLASLTPTDETEYAAMGVRMAEKGYQLPKPTHS